MRTTDETDTDRIIAAQAEQAHKTRALLAWLLLGVPVLAGMIWLIVVAIHSDISSSTSADQGCDAPDPVIVDLTTCPLSGPQLYDGTPCSTFNHWWNDVAGDPTKTNPANYFLYQHDLNGQALEFGKQCQIAPHLTLGDILDANDLPRQPVNN